MIGSTDDTKDKELAKRRAMQALGSQDKLVRDQKNAAGVVTDLQSLGAKTYKDIKKYTPVNRNIAAPTSRSVGSAKRPNTALAMIQPRQVNSAIQANTPKRPELLTRENSDMGWKSRLALNKQMLSNYQSGSNASMAANTARTRDANSLTLGQEGNALTSRGQDLDYESNLMSDSTARRGQDNAYNLGNKRNEIAEDTQGLVAKRNEVLNEQTALQTKAGSRALDKADNMENARQSYAQALAEGDPDQVARSRAQLDTYHHTGTKETEGMTEKDRIKANQAEMNSYAKFASNFNAGDPNGSIEAYLKRKKEMMQGLQPAQPAPTTSQFNIDHLFENLQ